MTVVRINDDDFRGDVSVQARNARYPTHPLVALTLERRDDEGCRGQHAWGRDIGGRRQSAFRASIFAEAHPSEHLHRIPDSRRYIIPSPSSCRSLLYRLIMADEDPSKRVCINIVVQEEYDQFYWVNRLIIVLACMLCYLFIMCYLLTRRALQQTNNRKSQFYNYV